MTATKRLLLLSAVLLALPLIAECWISRAIQHRQHFLLTSSSFSSSTLQRNWRHDVVLRAKNDKENLDGVYNDDAFGLVFLSSFFVAKDYTFSACFGALSMIAFVFVQFRGVPFNPILPGAVALASLLLKSIIGNVVTDVIPEDTALPVELGASVVSLVWGFIQMTRENQVS